MARPKKLIDYITVEKLAQMMCTQEEIASFLGISSRTLQRDEEFCRIHKKGMDTGKMSLRRNQFKMSETNPTMAIWLGKQYLGQSDKIEQKNEHNVSIEYQKLSIEELKEQAKELGMTEEEIQKLT